MTVTVSSKGQVVIPAELRKRYGIEPNSKIEFIDTGEEIVVVPLKGKDPFGSTCGILKEVSSKDVAGSRRRDRENEKTKEKGKSGHSSKG